MGMNESFMGDMEKGLGMFQRIQSSLGGGPEKPNYAKQADEQARMMEIDARDDALDILRKAERTASIVRDDRERNRANSAARWGGSNIAMSGSAQLVRDSQRIKDRQEEEDVLFEGEAQAMSSFRKKRRQADLFRIQNDASPRRTTLSMGSKIYK